MYWPPDAQMKVIKQRQRELIDEAESLGLLRGVPRVPVRVRLRTAAVACLKAFRLKPEPPLAPTPRRQ